MAEKGSHEALVFHSVPAEGGMLQADLMVSNFTILIVLFRFVNTEICTISKAILRHSL